MDHQVEIEIADDNNADASVYSEHWCNDSASVWEDTSGRDCAAYAANAQAHKRVYDCGFGGLITSQAGTLSDGDGTYGPNARCQWILSPASASEGVKLTVQELVTADLNDLLRVWSCTTADCSDMTELFMSTPLHSTPSTPIILETLSGHIAMKVDFYSNGDANTAEGFVARFAAESSPHHNGESALQWWENWCHELYAGNNTAGVSAL